MAPWTKKPFSTLSRQQPNTEAKHNRSLSEQNLSDQAAGNVFFSLNTNVSQNFGLWKPTFIRGWESLVKIEMLYTIGC